MSYFRHIFFTLFFSINMFVFVDLVMTNHKKKHRPTKSQTWTCVMRRHTEYSLLNWSHLFNSPRIEMNSPRCSDICGQEFDVAPIVCFCVVLTIELCYLRYAQAANEQRRWMSSELCSQRSCKVPTEVRWEPANRHNNGSEAHPLITTPNLIIFAKDFGPGSDMF